MDGGITEGGILHLSPVQEAAAKLSFVVLSAAHESYVLEISKVLEIIRIPGITWIPGARPPVRGLINLRGSIVTVLDLAEFVSGNSCKADERARIVVVEGSGLKVGLLVESATSVAEIPADSIHPPMTTLDEAQRKFILAQTNIGQLLVGILDVDGLVLQARAMQAST